MTPLSNVTERLHFFIQRSLRKTAKHVCKDENPNKMNVKQSWSYLKLLSGTRAKFLPKELLNGPITDVETKLFVLTNILVCAEPIARKVQLKQLSSETQRILNTLLTKRRVEGAFDVYLYTQAALGFSIRMPPYPYYLAENHAAESNIKQATELERLEAGTEMVQLGRMGNLEMDTSDVNSDDEETHGTDHPSVTESNIKQAAELERLEAGTEMVQLGRMGNLEMDTSDVNSDDEETHEPDDSNAETATADTTGAKKLC
jgi:hypothetical protein